MSCLWGAEDGGKGQYLICLESSDVSNVSADLQVSNEGLSLCTMHHCYI